MQVSVGITQIAYVCLSRAEFAPPLCDSLCEMRHLFRALGVSNEGAEILCGGDCNLTVTLASLGLWANVLCAVVNRKGNEGPRVFSTSRFDTTRACS